MVGVQEVESERYFRTIKRCRVPAHPQKLAVMFHRVSARTELYVHAMGAVEVSDEDLLRVVCRRARSMLVANIETEPQFEKARALIKTIPPNLKSG